MQHIQSQSEWENEMCIKVLELIRNELYLELRYFHTALYALKAKSSDALWTFATDGIFLYYPSARMLHIFQDNQKFLTRAYLHSVLHCIFSHLWIAGSRDRQLWNTACDIAVEYTIDKMEKDCTKRILTYQRQQMYASLEQEKTFLSAAVIYRMLLQLPEEQQRYLQAEFYTDDHCYWPVEKQQSIVQQEARSKWDKLARQAKIQQEQQGMDTKDGERLLASQIKAERSRRSYSDFLKKFTKLHEELRCDPDEFDLNFYIYGLALYKNMPLVEPLETRETKKIREFVIVIDTSDSTSGELVKNFLRETFQILNHREHFFAKCKIRILQCDDRIRTDQEITSSDDFEHLLETFKLIGGGGTDFRPAFSYVNELIEQKVFERLGGLLYFTDGLGVYPKKCPPYKTAFLFLDDYDERSVPPWAMRLRLEPEDFTQKTKRSSYEYQTGKTGD